MSSLPADLPADFGAAFAKLSTPRGASATGAQVFSTTLSGRVLPQECPPSTG